MPTARDIRICMPDFLVGRHLCDGCSTFQKPLPWPPSLADVSTVDLLASACSSHVPHPTTVLSAGLRWLDNGISVVSGCQIGTSKMVIRVEQLIGQEQADKFGGHGSLLPYTW